MSITQKPVRIAGPVANPKAPRETPPPGAWDAHAHIFGPADQFPYAPGRGYTPPDAPVERYIALLDRLGLARGLVVQGNAHGYDNRVVLDALARYPQRLRGVAITDTRVALSDLRAWHALGMRGLRFHLLPEDPGYVRGVGLNVFETFRATMRELGWVMQIFCDHRVMVGVAPTLRAISREMPVIVDHMLMVPAAKGVNEPNFQALLRLVGEGAVHVKVSAAYRLSDKFPDYPDARPFHDALVAANPERLVWGTDWPHPWVTAAAMPDEGHLLDLFYAWTPDERVRRKILVETPTQLFAA
ncbi:MAG: amidohydrolase family protein [Rhizobiales bacterium]|nr:amidohydrolase family protein [Hyphomicrobiales bacterium]